VLHYTLQRVSKSKSTGPYVDDHQSVVQRSKGLDLRTYYVLRISDYQRTRSNVGPDLCLLYATYVTVHLFWIDCHVFPTKKKKKHTEDVANHKLRVHVRVILYSLAMTSANVTSSEFPVSVFRNIYACHCTVVCYFHKTAIQARAELIASIFFLSFSVSDTHRRTYKDLRLYINPLKPELNSICYLLTLLGAHHFLHVSRIRVKLLTLRLLMSYIYIYIYIFIYIYGATILDVSRSHTTTQHSR